MPAARRTPAGSGDLFPLFVLVGVIASVVMLQIAFLHHADAAFTKASEDARMQVGAGSGNRTAPMDPAWRTGGEIRLGRAG